MPMQRTCVLLVSLAACGDNRQIVDEPDPDVDASPEPPAAVPGFQLLDFAIAVDVTPDGRTAVFESFTSSVATVHFHDTITGTSVEETAVGDPSRNLATGVSLDGRLSALHGEPVQAGLWSEAAGWHDL